MNVLIRFSTSAIALLFGALAAVTSSAQTDVEIVCPCTLFSSSESDSAHSSTSARVSATLRNNSGQATGPLRISIWAHAEPGLFASFELGSETNLVSYVSLPSVNANTTIPQATYVGGFRPEFLGSNEPLYYTMLFEEFSQGGWRRKNRIRMAGRARSGTEGTSGGRSAGEEWVGLAIDGLPSINLSGNTFAIDLSGLRNVSTVTDFAGNLTLQLRWGNTFGQAFIVESQALTDLNINAGANIGPTQFTGSYSDTPNPSFNDLYLTIRDAGGLEVMRLDLPDTTTPAPRYVDLRSIDFIADSDGDGVSDEQEILALSDPTNAADTPAKPTIRLLVYHTAAAAADLGGNITTGVIHALESVNQIYTDSDINAELELAALESTTFSDDDTITAMLNAMASASGSFAGLDNSRVNEKADLVLGLKSDGPSDFFCGQAFLYGVGTRGDMGDQSRTLTDSAVGVARADCGVTTIAHELGHMMGLSHSRPQNITEDSIGTFPWSAGHGENNLFHTIMSYDDPWGPAADEVSLFSNPQVTCEDEDLTFSPGAGPDFARPCGVDRSNVSDGADSALSLDSVGYQIARFTADTDGDGTIDLFDTDDDGDGTPDTADLAPLDALSTLDADLDGISDARDPDNDNDGTVNGNDAFPFDRLESADTDGDGTGDNADLDDDNDTFTDDEELAAGSNPLDAADTPAPQSLPIGLLKAIIDQQSP